MFSEITNLPGKLLIQDPFYVYQTRKNSDMTEGRGPMISDACFLFETDAREYIVNQPGVMGRKLDWNNEKYGDWDVVPVRVCLKFVDRETLRKQKVKEDALRRLTTEEKELLGLK